MGVLSWAAAVSAAGTLTLTQSRVAIANRPATENVWLGSIGISLPRRDNATVRCLCSLALRVHHHDAEKRFRSRSRDHAVKRATWTTNARAVPCRQTGRDRQNGLPAGVTRRVGATKRPGV